MTQLRTFVMIGLFALTGCMGNEVSNSATSPARVTTVSSSMDSTALNATPINTYITHLYQSALNRQPESAGLTYWANAYGNGASCKAIAQGILQSSDNALRNELLSNSTDPTYAALYVHSLYAVLFNRSADSAGSSYWVSALQSGVSVQSVDNGFLNSSEFQSVCKAFGV